MSKISEKVKSLDVKNQMEAVLKEQLDTLVSLTNHMTEQAENSIRESLRQGAATGGYEVPVTYVIQHTSEERAIASETRSDIIKKLGEGISHFFNPGKQEILNGVVSIVSDTIDALLGAGEGMEASQRVYLVAEEYPSLVRMDFQLWVRNTRAVGLSTLCKSALSVVGFKSAVDVKKLDFATFSAIYSPLLAKAYGSDIKGLEEALAKAEELYKRLGGKLDSANASVPALSEPLKTPMLTVSSSITEF